ncbi:hydrogenase 4 subunit B [Raoultibacter massiliensis]|uniref:Hydrogenase 4 subunit B n=1 Tax=Raoultibacter massiliensis TaxID=1852371 RepID=A0ABV1JDR8_9ACTN|nr:hydrogenase 4 subunit B [Raoultibacter massiliensis]
MGLTLLVGAGGISVVGALVSLLLYRQESAVKFLSCSCGVVSSVLALGFGLISMLGPTQVLRAVSPFGFADFSISCNPLSGLLIAVISVLAIAAWIYGFSYFDEYRGRGIGKIGFYMNLFVISMIFVVAVDNAFWFLVFFELMSLTSYFLVVFDRSEQAQRGGFVYFVMAHIGFLMIMVAFLMMANAAGGSFEFSDFRQVAMAPAAASIVFMLAFLGFGIKAGMVPFHSWLPLAHPEAPSNVSALMSGGMVKIGIFGIVKVCFDLLGASGCQLWWGFVVMMLGVVSAVFGIAYAVAERDIKRTLAYCTVENIGIVLIGVGVAIFGMALEQPIVATLGLLGGLYHLVNHAMFKGALFLGAGSAIFRVHTRSLDAMGGLARRMPWTAAVFLIASVAICAIPPLNGFASEWITYQSLLDVSLGAAPLIKTAAVLAAASLAISGALAIVCFVKAYGVAFSGAPRSEKAREAREVPVAMVVGSVLLAAICICLGVGAAWIAPAIGRIAASVLGMAASTAPVALGSELVNPLAGTGVSFILIAVLLIVLALLLVGLRAVVRRRAGAGLRKEPWDCGYLPEREMLAASTSFSSAAGMFFAALYRARDLVSAQKVKVEFLYERLVGGIGKAEPLSDRYLVDGVIGIVSKLSQATRKVEGGDYRVYVSYVVVALVFFLILTVAIG